MVSAVPIRSTEPRAGRSRAGPVCAFYLARFQPTSAVPPIDAGSTVHFMSSPVKEMTDRFCSVPVQLGHVLPSTLRVITLSATEYVPKWAMLPCTIALFSSGVPVLRLPDANLGRLAVRVTDA